MSTTSDYIVRMAITEESRAVLQQFSATEPGIEPGGNVQDVFFALEAIVLNVELMNQDQLLHEEAKNSWSGWFKENFSLHNVLLVSMIDV